MTPDELADLVAQEFPHTEAVEITHGQLTIDVSADAWIEALRYTRNSLECTFFDWLSAVDEGEDGIRVVMHVYSPSRRHHVLVRTLLPPDHPTLPSSTSVFRGANWHERETYEMFGVEFTDHPYLEPLLLPDGFEGHPLRKDFVLASRVAKQWPGAVDPGQSAHDVAVRRKRKLPPGVPDPDVWGPDAVGDQ
jgi:NADH-quinone oxidoreductase subunit C